MKAYIIVLPTNLKPRFFKSLARILLRAVSVGQSFIEVIPSTLRAYNQQMPINTYQKF